MNKLSAWLLFLGMIATVAVHSQTGRTVEGMLRDTESRPISGASVQLISDLDSLATSSTAAGIYTFENVKGRKFKIRVSSLGFDTYEREFEYPEGKEKMFIPSFILEVNANLIEEVVVSGVLTVQVKGDTVDYSAKDLKLREGALAEDALKRLQGVEVDKDGNVTAQGEAVTRVRINGKDFFGGDVKTATQNLPANIIERIQVIDDYGDMANLTGNRTGDSEKVLNIVIDPEYNKGHMSTIRVGYGTDDRYQTTAMWMGLTDKTQVSVLGNLNNINASLFDFNTQGGGARRRPGGGRGGGMFGPPANGITNTGAIGLNIRHDFSDKLKVYGSYSYGRDDNSTISDNFIRNIISNPDASGDSFLVEDSNSDQNQITAAHRFESNIEWNITDRDYLKLTPQVGFNSTNVRSMDSTANILDDILNSTQVNRATSESTAPRFDISGLYNHRFNDRGRNLFINFAYNNAVTESDYQNLIERFLEDAVSTTPVDDIYEQTIRELRNKSWTAGTALSYTEPLTEKAKLEFTYDYNTNVYDNRNYQQGFDRDGAPTDIPELNFDYNYDYSFTSHRVGASYMFEHGNVKYSLGGAVQPTLLKGDAYSLADYAPIDRNNFNFIPVARFEYKFSRQSNLSADYSGRATEPTLTQILPFPVSTNRTMITYGNAELDPEFRHQLRLRYRGGDFQKGSNIFAVLTGSVTNNRIVNFTKTIPSDELGVRREIGYLNETEDPVYNVGSFFHMGRSYKDRTYNISLMGRVQYTKNVSYVANDPAATIDDADKNIANDWVFGPGLMFRYTPSEKLEINPGVRYQYQTTHNSLQDRRTNVSSWTPTLNGSVNITASTIFGADVSKTFNSGFGPNANVNPFIINTYIEQRFLKGQRGALRIQAFDLLNEQTNITRTVQDNFYSDSRINRLGRYFMMSFTFRFQKFALGAPPEGGFPGGGRRRF